MTPTDQPDSETQPDIIRLNDSKQNVRDSLGYDAEPAKNKPWVDIKLGLSGCFTTLLIYILYIQSLSREQIMFGVWEYGYFAFIIVCGPPILLSIPAGLIGGRLGRFLMAKTHTTKLPLDSILSFIGGGCLGAWWWVLSLLFG